MGIAPSQIENDNTRPQYTLHSSPIADRPRNVVRFIQSAGFHTKNRILVACTPEDRLRWQKICFNFAKRRELCVDVQYYRNGKVKESHLNTNAPHMPDESTWHMLEAYNIESKTPTYTYRKRKEEANNRFDWSIETSDHGSTERCELVLMDSEQFYRWRLAMTDEEIDFKDQEMILHALKRNCDCLVGGSNLCVLCYKDEYQGRVLMADPFRTQEGPDVFWFQIEETQVTPWVEWIDLGTSEGGRRLEELTGQEAPLRNWQVGDFGAAVRAEIGKKTLSLT
ncbi:hypothetical protein HYFRA_00010810 [Hymenoscyphus fraxineus]|uniref:Uncharacterized protein n=1 Tax=Hymenoscyphus fraxineus TaxID=746836 RepID=A0A9N9L1H9_9HELO|nr:hypothetical protein HYFRA_00010810 [Hymenoscyphus fraxineus]